MSNLQIPTIEGRNLMVTDDGMRTHVECSCGLYSRHASKRSGNVKALQHYEEHAGNQADKMAARKLIDERVSTR